MNDTQISPEQLTVKEALEQGYTHYGSNTGDFQHLSRLEDITAEDFESNEWRGGDIVLADKEPYYLNTSAEGSEIR